MGTRIRPNSLAALALLTPLWCIGCKDKAPAPILAEDLGTQGKPLVLPADTFHIVEINKGQADWVPFREPGSTPTPTTEDTPAEDNQPEENATVAEIKTFIVDYNNLSEEGGFDELKTYIVDSQSESIAAAFTVAAEARKKIDALKTQLSLKLSDQMDRIETTLDKVRDSADDTNGTRLSALSITVVNENEATATTPPGSLTPTLKFVVIEDAWYLEFPALADAETLADQLSKKVDTYDSMLSQLSDDTTTAEKILSNLEETLAAETNSGELQDEDLESAEDSDDENDDADDEATADDGTDDTGQTGD